jgi:hypothetical protein
MAEPCPGRARDRLCNGGHEGQKQCQGLLGYLSNYWRHQGDYAESRELSNSKGLEDAKPYSAQQAQFALKSHSSRVSFSIFALCIQDLVYNHRSHCNIAGDIT